MAASTLMSGIHFSPPPSPSIFSKKTPTALSLLSKPFSSSSTTSTTTTTTSSKLSLPRKWNNCILLPPTVSAAASSEATVEEETVEESMPPPVEAQIAASAAAESPKGEDVFAVVMIGSRQYIVFPGRFIYTQRLKEANANDKIILNKVLLVGTRTKTYIGQPVVTNAAVHAVVEEQGLDKKVIVFKYKKKKNYRRNIGHRQPNTRIRITGISGYEDFPAETMPTA